MTAWQEFLPCFTGSRYMEQRKRRFKGDEYEK